MKVAYTDGTHLSWANERKLVVINKIIEEYMAQDLTLTLRQLYYQLVSRDIIPNKASEYSKLSGLIVKGRMGGVVDWDAIEDRIRIPKLPYYVDDVSNAIDDTIEQYRLDRQREQKNYIEVWVEKDALSGVLYPITERYHVRLMVNRGYSSLTAMRDASLRFRNAKATGQRGYILYLGDHDPSGLDMIRDIKTRLEGLASVVDVIAIGITYEQIQEFNPPPNPAKFKDPRADWYIEKFGPVSWEVDALPPKYLNELLVEQIESRIDLDLYNKFIKQEKKDKETLQRFADNMEEE